MKARKRKTKQMNQIQKMIQSDLGAISTSMESRYRMLGLGASWAAKRSKLKVRRRKGAE